MSCGGVLIPNRDSPNGYPTVRPAELQSITLSHQVDSHKTLTTHNLACSCFVALFGHQYSSGPCVHFGTKFKVLIAYFIENKQQSDSVHLFTIIKTNKTKTLFSVLLLNIILSHKEIRY